MRVALVTNIPTGYREPLYSQIHRRLAGMGGELLIVYGALNESDRQWELTDPPLSEARTVVLRWGQARYRGRATYISPFVPVHLARFAPDVVVLSGFAPWILSAAAWCRARLVPYVIWSGDTAFSVANRGVWHPRRRWLMRHASSFLAYGPDAKDYLTGNGIPSDRVTVLGNGIDTEAYGRRIENFRAHREEIQREFGIAEGAVLSVGGKGLGLVVSASASMKEPPQIVVVGTSVDVSPRLRVLGRLPAASMPKVYAASTCLAHAPIYDQWPHAINEALSGGLPVVATEGCGIPPEICSGPGSAIVGRTVTEIAEFLPRAVAVGSSADAETRRAIAAPLRPWGVPEMCERFVDTCVSAASLGVTAHA